MMFCRKLLADFGRSVVERFLLHFHFEHAVEKRLQRGLGLLLGDAGLEPAESIYPALAAVRQKTQAIGIGNYLGDHHDRNENLRGVAQLHTVETRLAPPR